MKGIWVWGSDDVYFSHLDKFDTIFIDIEKDKKKAEKFMKKADEWAIHPVINCFENRNPDNEEDLQSVFEQILSYKNYGDNLCLDFIRYTTPTMSRDSYRIINSVVKFAKGQFKNLRCTIMPFGEFYGQNHWAIKKEAIIMPMLYYNPFWVGFFKRLYGNCEPIIKGWDTNFDTLMKCRDKAGKNYSLFRYGTFKELLRYCKENYV